MFKNQFTNRDITDKKIIDVMLKVPRHKFVSKELKNEAYDDNPLPIGFGQTISQPYIVAYMTQELCLKPNNRVLEIGTGSGYQTAVLAELSKEVFSIEIIEELAKKAENILKELGYNNIWIKYGDGYYGWEEKSPFDAIIVSAAAKSIPEALISQLSSNGTLVIPVGQEPYQIVKIIKKDCEGNISISSGHSVRFVPFIHLEKE